MAEKDDTIHRDLYERMNKTDAKLSNLIGETSMIVKQNEQLIGLLKTALKYMFYIIVVLILAIIYGAIGKEGFNAIKGSSSTAVLANAKIIAISSDNGSADIWRFFNGRKTA